MAQKQIDSKKRRNIALGICIPVAVAGIAAGVTIPLVYSCKFQEHKEVIPYAALNIAESQQERLPDYPTCNILYGFKPEWLQNNKLKGYSVLEIPETVDYIAPNAFITQAEESNDIISTIPDNVKVIRFAERTEARDFDQNRLIIDEGAFRGAPVTTLKLPDHLGGSYSGPNDNDNTNGPFADMTNLRKIDLSTLSYSTAVKLGVDLSWGCFSGSGVEPAEEQQQCAILFNPDYTSNQINSFSAVLYNCGLNKDKWFYGVAPRATSVYVDDDGIVQGFLEGTSTELILYELYAYEELDHWCLRIPANAKAIADGAFENWGGFEIGSQVQGIIFEDDDQGAEKSQIKTIGNNAFKGCKFANDVTINIPSSVTTLGDSSFANIEQLTSISFKGNNVTSIGKGAFAECTKLQQIPAFDKLTKISEISEDCFARCSSLKNVSLSSNIKTVNKNAFTSCNIQSVSFASKDQLTICEGAFANNKINQIDLSGLVTANGLEIKEGAFNGNESTGLIVANSMSWEVDWGQWYWNTSVREQLFNGGINVDGINWKLSETIDDLNRALFKYETESNANTVKITGFNHSDNSSEGLSDASIVKLIKEINGNNASDRLSFPSSMKINGVDTPVKEITGFGHQSIKPYFPTGLNRISFNNTNGLSISDGALL